MTIARFRGWFSSYSEQHGPRTSHGPQRKSVEYYESLATYIQGIEEDRIFPCDMMIPEIPPPKNPIHFNVIPTGKITKTKFIEPRPSFGNPFSHATVYCDCPKSGHRVRTVMNDTEQT